MEKKMFAKPMPKSITKKQRGFTMAQMLASVAIGSVLTSAGAVFYWDAVDRAKVVTERQTMNSLNDAVSISMGEAGSGYRITDAFRIDLTGRVSSLNQSLRYAVMSWTKTPANPGDPTLDVLFFSAVATTDDQAAMLKQLAPKLDEMIDIDTTTLGADKGRFVYDTTCNLTTTPSTNWEPDCYYGYYLLGNNVPASSDWAATIGAEFQLDVDLTSTATTAGKFPGYQTATAENFQWVTLN